MRTPSNVVLSDKCPRCGKRIFLKGENKKHERRYYAPDWLRKMFMDALGSHLLGSYGLRRCEVCGITVAVFDHNKGRLADEVYALYSCSLLSVPLDESICSDRKSCYACPAKESEDFAKKY